MLLACVHPACYPTRLSPFLVILTACPYPSDKWIAVVKSRARYAEISSAIDISKKEEPPRPTEPAIPTYGQFHPNALSLSDLTPGEEKDHRQSYGLWKQRMITYRAQIQALQDIQNFFMTSVSRQHIRYADRDTVWQALVALKKRLAPTDRAGKHELKKVYRQLLTGPKSQNTEKWIQDW
jgi:hypothetical protein